MYESLVKWLDLEDGHLYKTGDQFPFDGRKIPDERIAELSGKQNRAGFALIKVVAIPFEETLTSEEKPVKKATRSRKKAE